MRLLARLVCLLSLGIGGLAPTDAAAAKELRVELRERQGVWAGWGTSLAWWANVAGSTSYADGYADLLFTLNDAPILGQLVPGLGLNIVRYNIGASGSVGEPPTGEVVSPLIPSFRRITGFWPALAPDSPPLWRWTGDASQRRLLQLAVARGVDQVEFFANAPMWWMTDSRSADGGTLLPEHVDDFAWYLANVVHRAGSDWGVKVTSLAPFNEPSALWWQYPKNQEGASIAHALQPALLRSLHRQLTAMGHGEVTLAAADENSAEAAQATLDRFRLAEVNDVVGLLNVHGYRNGTQPQRNDAERTALRRMAGRQPIQLSEYGDNDPSGLTLAQTIIADLRYLQPRTWVYWQAIEEDPRWGFIQSVYLPTALHTKVGEPLQVNTKYYVMAQFSRFIRPGDQLYVGPDDNHLLVYNAQNRRLTLIALVIPARANMDYDLRPLFPGGVVPPSTQAVISKTSFDGQSLLQTWSQPLVAGHLTLYAARSTIFSIVLEGVAQPSRGFTSKDLRSWTQG